MRPPISRSLPGRDVKAAGVDTLFLMTTPKFGAQTIRKIAELGWKPLTYLSAVSTSLKTVLEPAGLDNSKGLITALAVKRPDDPRWENEKDVQDYKAFLKQWYPTGNMADSSNIAGYMAAFVTVKILELCGDDLTRENLLRQATNLTDLAAPLLLPGITITTTPTRYTPFRQMQIARFDGITWVPEGPLISANEPQHRSTCQRNARGNDDEHGCKGRRRRNDFVREARRQRKLCGDGRQGGSRGARRCRRVLHGDPAGLCGLRLWRFRPADRPCSTAPA